MNCPSLSSLLHLAWLVDETPEVCPRLDVPHHWIFQLRPAEDLAISRKNDRTWQESLDSAERFRLTPMDFGLEALADAVDD